MFKFKLMVFLLMSLTLAAMCGCGVSDQLIDSNTQSKSSIDAESKTGSKTASELNISLYPSYIEIAKGKTVMLSAKFVPENVELNQLKWVSENSEVASVSTNGLVTANKEGVTIINALLKIDPLKKASCVIRVNADGSTFLYPNVPQNPADSNGPLDDEGDGSKLNDEPKQEGDENIPTEYDQSQDIPVEVIPTLDEFIWTIYIDDACEKSLDTEMGSIKATYHLKLVAIKKGGKTSDGQYQCTASQDVKVDSSDMDQEIGNEINGTVESDNSVTAELKDCTFNIVPYDSNTYISFGTNKGEVLPSLPPLNLAISKMATGNMTFSTDATFGKTITTEEGSGTGKGKVTKANQAIPFKIYMTKDGRVSLTFMGRGSLGPLEFRGRLSKKPIRPS